MREIKFRAWVKEINSQQKYSGMYPVFSLAPDGVSVVRASVFAPNLFPIEDVVIMQYTGLKDENGKEIYEGDIVRGYYANLDWEGNDTGKVRIEIIDDIRYMQNKFPDTDCEVIGNIYENQELINNKNK